MRGMVEIVWPPLLSDQGTIRSPSAVPLIASRACFTWSSNVARRAAVVVKRGGVNAGPPVDSCQARSGRPHWAPSTGVWRCARQDLPTPSTSGAVSTQPCPPERARAACESPTSRGRILEVVTGQWSWSVSVQIKGVPAQASSQRSIRNGSTRTMRAWTACGWSGFRSTLASCGSIAAGSSADGTRSSGTLRIPAQALPRSCVTAGAGSASHPAGREARFH